VIRRAPPALFAALAALLLGLFIPGQPAFADGPIVTEYRVEPPPRLTIGDHVPVTIVLQADRGTQVQIAAGGIPEDLALAESVRFSERDIAGGRVEVRVNLVLAPFLIGNYEMPPIVLRYREQNGQVGQVETPSARLVIESTVPGNVQPELRGLKPQAVFPPPAAVPAALFLAMAAALVLALVLLAVAWRRTHRPVPVPAPPLPEPVLSPEDAARRALDGAGAAFAQDRDYGRYYAVISNTVRTYLTRRFGFPAFALTTTELQRQMVFRGMDRWQARLAGGLLEQCDSVMWAAYEPALERADADLTAAYEVVEMSRPVEAPEQEEVAVT
jgi:hypothetical protein